jgi:site-specific DNA-methyltransferase (adenine-specific)
MLELNKIYCGDCLEVMRGIDDKSIDMILCDLPYGTTACKWDSVIPFEPMWEQLKRIIKDNGAIVLTASQPFTSALVMSNVKMFKYEWVWNKNKASNIMLAKHQPLKIHENILVFGGSNYFPQKTDVVGKIRDQRLEKEKINRTDGAVTPKGAIKYADNYDPSKKYPVSIQYFPNHREKENVLHPTQKPVALFEYLIKTYTNEGDLVLDNCAGSFTTAIASIRTKRNWIGIEMDKGYCEIAENRIKEELKQKPLNL